MSIIQLAEAFARGAHAGQKHGDRPYWTHLEGVAKIVESLGSVGDEKIICAAWLHDTIEDTSVTYQHILEFFGFDIAEIVWNVTDEIGRNRKERKEKTYQKIFSTPESTILKLADLYDNVSKSIENDDRYQKMYIREWPGIHKMFLDGLSRHCSYNISILEELDNKIKEIDH